jgi:HK97 family phage prohead protease
MTSPAIVRGDARRVEFRAAGGDAAAAAGFDGHASTAWHVDSYGTAFAPGAWSKTISERGDKVLVLWQHDPYQPIGRPTALAEDGAGLAVTAAISDGTSYGRDALALLRDGVPLGLSVGFRTIRERPATEQDPLLFEGAPESIRGDYSQVSVIEEAKLYEFSLVSFPANDAAQVGSVRGDAQADALAALLADVRAGRVAPLCRGLLEDLVAAWRDAPDGLRPEPRAVKAPRRIDAETVLAMYGHMQTQMGAG